jgi:DNA modification methylase
MTLKKLKTSKERRISIKPKTEVNSSKKKGMKVNEPEIYFINRENKVLDESWDFRKSNTKEFTHCFHQYPAMMIPQVARRIIDNYGHKSKILFDPYCGTGTSLVEANLNTN